MGEKILITGGAGFIGCALGAELVARGDEVLAFDSLHPQVHSGLGLPRRMAPGVAFVPGDVTVSANFQALFKYFRPDVVVHLAAETGTGQSLTEASRHANVNVVGTAQLMDAQSGAGHVPRQIILASSRAIYGDGAWQDEGGEVFYPQGRSRQDLENRRWDFKGTNGRTARPLPHDASSTTPTPISVYGSTKLSQEHMLAAWCRAFRSKLTVLRLQNVYGVGQAPHNAYTGILTLFVRQARAGKIIDVYEDGEIIRDFVHVSDVIQAMTKALSATATSEVAFDIGSGQPTTILAVARKVASLFAAPEPVVSGKFRDGDVRAASCSIASARSKLGYEPRTTLDAGLATLLSAGLES